MANLDKQCKEFNIVINVPKRLNNTEFNIALINLNERLTQQGYMYASMVHDKDVNADGTMKTYHVHYVIWSSKRCRIETMLYRLLDYLKFDASEFTCIQIDKCNDVAFSIQYLTHKNHKDKFQYNYNYIITNCSEQVIKDYYNSECTLELTTRQLVQWIVYDRMSNVELMFKLGISRYHYYKAQIDEIRQTYYRADDESLKMLKAIERQYQKD